MDILAYIDFLDYLINRKKDDDSGSYDEDF